ncbi:MAG: hypothetical protein ACYTGN_14270 [Planctomycetota bacterium]|jgi:hypothetical protein
MKRILLVALFVAPGVLSQDKEKSAEEGPRWPREYVGENGGTLVVYQPQVESWADYRKLKAWYALAVKPPGEENEILGSMLLSMKTTTDQVARTVTASNPKIEKLNFPGLTSSKNKKVRDAVKFILPKKPVQFSLDLALASLSRTAVKDRKVKVNTDPPKIQVVLQEAMLIVFDGEPMAEPIEGTDLEVGLNTASAILRTKNKQTYYLQYDRSWLTAPGPSGPWSSLKELPPDLAKLPDDGRWTEVKKNIPGIPLKDDEMPRVLYATEPTELIVIYGTPVLDDIPGTKLSYVKNTESDLFVLGQTYYLLVAGRWFKSESLSGPWVFTTEALPADFGKIPDDHTCGRVLASVPKTEQAKEAAIENSIPRMAQVKRDEAKVDVSYDGDAAFEPIEGTQVQYATNTSFDVFQATGKFYCCYQGVWFVADAAAGPWAVADKVPAEIYQIPSTHPSYNVTYCAVYESDDDYVYTCYTPGYYGSYYYGGVVVYGAGWRWRWRRSYWRHWYRWHRPRPTPYRRRAWYRHGSYGQGRYYDHMSGRYRAGTAATVHHRNRAHMGGAYQGWSGGVKRTAVARRTQVHRPKPAARPNNHYAGRDGSLHRNHNGQWQSYKNGKWQNTPRQPRANQPRQPKAHSRSQLQRSQQARRNSTHRRTQYRNYRSSRGHRASSYRGGRSRGGGGRGGGGRRR